MWLKITAIVFHHRWFHLLIGVSILFQVNHAEFNYMRGKRWICHRYLVGTRKDFLFVHLLDTGISKIFGTACFNKSMDNHSVYFNPHNCLWETKKAVDTAIGNTVVAEQFFFFSENADLHSIKIIPLSHICDI